MDIDHINKRKTFGYSNLRYDNYKRYCYLPYNFQLTPSLMQFGDWTIQMQTYSSPLNPKNWTHHAIQLYTIITSFYNVNPNNWTYEALLLMNYSTPSLKHHTPVACCFLHSLFLPWELHAHVHCLHMVTKPHLSQSWYFFF